MTKDDALVKAIEALTKIDLWLKVRYDGIGLMPQELEVVELCKKALSLPNAEPVAYRQHITVTKLGVITHEYGYSDIQIMQSDDALCLKN